MGNRLNWSLLVLMGVSLTFAAAAPSPPQPEPSITTQRGALQASSGQDDWDVETKKILQTANSWRTGDPIPPALRRFRQYGSDIPTTMDSDALMAQVQNLPLLATIVLDPGSDNQCREDAFAQGMEVGGPNQFFSLLRPLLAAPAAKDFEPWVNEVRDRISRPHAVVNALFIEDRDMPRRKALMVIERITADLRGGMDWSQAYKQYSEEFSYPADAKTGDRTKIGLLGPLVIFPDPELGKGYMATITSRESKTEYVQWQGPPSPRHLWGLSYFDAAHLPILLKANAGDVISLRSKLYHEYVLYQVKEIYKGELAKRPQ